MKKYTLEAVVLISGAVVMIFELIGSRIIGPYVGTSTYTWTSLIGVILASLSLGYYFGGKLADKKPYIKSLALILMLSAISILATTFLKDIVLFGFINIQIPIELKTIFISIILFAPASFFLGIVSPYAVRLRLNDISTTGRIAGNLYAISTFGSIVGTFLAGFYIISNFGSNTSLYFLVVLLLLSVLFLLGRSIFHIRIKKVIILAFTLTILFSGSCLSKEITFRGLGLMLDRDTEYNRIWVYKEIDNVTKKPTINLSTDPYGTQASAFTDGSDDLVFEYTKYYRLANYFLPNIKKALTIGGCIYSQPRDFLKLNSSSTIDAIEIDPGMTDIAREYFGLKDDPRLKIVHQDGRIFLNANIDKYDAIFVDAFNSASFTPFHLTTLEAVSKIFDSLNDKGIVITNVISSINGEKGKFFQTEYLTYSKVFSRVYAFAIDSNIDTQKVQNIMIVGIKGSSEPAKIFGAEAKIQLSHQISKDQIESRLPALTDDYAPVEYYSRLRM